MMRLPVEFVKQTENLLAGEATGLFEALDRPARTSVRINAAKPENDLQLKERVPWTTHGHYLDPKPVFTLDPYFHAGHYYVQEASSMIIGQVVGYLSLPSDTMALDLCAAPGGKTTHLMDLLGQDAFIHAHETVPHRAEILRQNVERWGRDNSCVTRGPIEKIIRSGLRYGLVLVDAPCSGEGMFRKDPVALEQWSPSKMRHCQTLQKDITGLAAALLDEGGVMIYSTCTFNHHENEEIVGKLLDEHSMECISMPWAGKFGLHESAKDKTIVYRCLPHRMEGEGLTFSVLRKKNGGHDEKRIYRKPKQSRATADTLKDLLEPGTERLTMEIHHGLYALRPAHLSIVDTLNDSGMQVLSAGIPLGHHKGKDWFPAHGLAMSMHVSSNFEGVQLDHAQALDYLRADSGKLPPCPQKSQWILARYGTARLGWIKLVAGKGKNYLPKNQRIHSL